MPEASFNAKKEEARERIVNETISQFYPIADSRGVTKVVVAGKGGVGKTVISATLCHLFAMSGSKVLAVDGDPQMNLAPTLGLPAEHLNSITPLNSQLDYIEEKVGARPGSGWGLFLRLNPKVDDVVSRFGVGVTEKIRLLVMGTLSKASIGCLCPENTLLEATVNHLALGEDEIVILDTEAGVEHFGRAIARGFQHAVVVTDPSYNSLSVATAALRLANDLGIPRLHLVCNKVHNDNDKSKAEKYALKANLGFDYTTTMIPYDEKVYNCDPSVLPILGLPESPFLSCAKQLFDLIQH